MSDSTEVFINATINEGCSFKGLIVAYVEGKMPNCGLVFTKTGISITEETSVRDMNKILLHSTMGGDNMLYTYNSTEEEFIFCGEIKSLSSITQNCLKPDSIRLFIDSSDTSKLHIEFFSNKISEVSNNIHCIVARQIERKTFILPKVSGHVVVGRMKEFSGIIKSLKKCKTNIIARVNGECISFQRGNENDSSQSAYRWGSKSGRNNNDCDPNQINTYVLDILAINMLVKLAGIGRDTDNVIIRSARGFPLVIECPIGNFGHHQKYFYSEIQE